MPVRPRLVVCLFLIFIASNLSIAKSAWAQTSKPELASLPLAIEPNRGQAPEVYKFVARRNSMETLFRNDGVDIVVMAANSAERLNLRWTHIDPATQLSAGGLMPGRSNYLEGNDPQRWFRNIPQFGQLRYNHIYPGIDLLFHGTGNSFEHDFVLEPGADPSAISFHFDKQIRIEPSGDILVDLNNGAVVLRRPVAYQMVGQRKNLIPVEYVLAENGEICFKLGSYDHNETLIIDPVFGFSTYLSGSNGENITAVTTDTVGNTYVTGFTSSPDFPITNSDQPLCPQCSDISASGKGFISKLDPTGHTLLYSTFFGGSAPNAANYPYAVALDPAGNIYVSGISSAFDFPHAGSVLPLSPTSYSSSFFFILSVKPDGSAFNYAGLVGGGLGFYTNGNQGKLAVDSVGNAYLAGTTSDSNFQLTSGTYDSTPGERGVDTMFVRGARGRHHVRSEIGRHWEIGLVNFNSRKFALCSRNSLREQFCEWRNHGRLRWSSYSCRIGRIRVANHCWRHWSSLACPSQSNRSRWGFRIATQLHSQQVEFCNLFAGNLSGRSPGQRFARRFLHNWNNTRIWISSFAKCIPDNDTPQ